MNAQTRVGQGKPAYPGKVAIRHVVEAAKSLGIDVAGIEVTPDGTIRVMEARAAPTQPKDLFDEWKDQL